MKDRKNARDTASFAVEWTQSDLPLFHTGLDLDDVPQVDWRDGDGCDELPAGVEGAFEILARRLEQLRADVLDPAQDGDCDDAPRSRFAATIAAVDAFDRLSSMAAALADEAITTAYAHSDEHLIDPDAEPGAPRPHLDRDGRLTETGDCWFDRFALTALGVGPALRIGTERAKNRVWDARQIARLAPHVHARRLAGDWSQWHGHVFVDMLTHLSDEQVSEADAAIASVPGRISVRVLRARIERWLRHNGLPQSGAEKLAEEQGHAARQVVVGATDLFGMATLSGYLPALGLRGIDQLLSDLAATAPADDPRSLAQRRADAFLACFTGPAALNPALAEQLGYAPAEVPDPRYAGTSVDPAQQAAAEEAWQTLQLIGASLGITFAKAPPAEINVHVSATTMMDLAAARDGKHATGDGGTQAQARHRDPATSNHPGDWHPPERPPECAPPETEPIRDPACPPDVDPRYVRGYRERHSRHFTPWVEGYGPITADYLAVLMGDAVLRRVLTDPCTGAPIDLGPRIYSPTAAMRRRVQLRDGTCRFPDCARSARRADLDHVIEHRGDGSGGRTADWNLIALCEHHHRAKHQTPWSPVLQDDGTVTWRNALIGMTITE